jgi:hypothetical protein
MPRRLFRGQQDRRRVGRWAAGRTARAGSFESIGGYPGLEPGLLPAQLPNKLGNYLPTKRTLRVVTSTKPPQTEEGFCRCFCLSAFCFVPGVCRKPRRWANASADREASRACAASKPATPFTRNPILIQARLDPGRLGDVQQKSRELVVPLRLRTPLCQPSALSRDRLLGTREPSWWRHRGTKQSVDPLAGVNRPRGPVRGSLLTATLSQYRGSHEVLSHARSRF